MTTNKKPRSSYTDDFKKDTVLLVTEQGYKISEAARSLGVGEGLIRRWRREFEEAATSGLSGDEREELKQLRKEVRQLRMEKDILKNRPPVFASHRIETRVRLQFCRVRGMAVRFLVSTSR